MITLRAAAEHAGRSEGTVRMWCQRYGIGRRVAGGPWGVSRVALAMLLDGNAEALAAYHRGDRHGPLVAPYFERARAWRTAADVARGARALRLLALLTAGA